MIHNLKGDLLDCKCDYICHQVNCQGVMGSGIAKQIRERFPEVFVSYASLCGRLKPEQLLGQIDIVNVDAPYNVINIFGQLDYGYDGARRTSYIALRDALSRIKAVVPYGMTIGFPKFIGCGLGGGDWSKVYKIIEETLGEHYEVYIYEYGKRGAR
jgi:O-acetyl-ADP-ribose deacetylase (regulator of RNase III)